MGEDKNDTVDCDTKCLCGKRTRLDPNVVSVMTKHRTRAEVGFKKYGVDTTRTDIDLVGWLVHLQEELMDANVYIERTLVELREKEEELEKKAVEIREREAVLDIREKRWHEHMTESI